VSKILQKFNYFYQLSLKSRLVHAVVIKGTEIYDSKYGAFVDLGILDVLQIFGRAGGPQFDTNGLGIIITTHDKQSLFIADHQSISN
jgi:replicative superfamily II helicase